MKYLLLDLDDTLLDYSGGVDDCWAAACASGCSGDDPEEPVRLVRAVAASRRVFWDDPLVHRRERVNMLGAWTKIVEGALVNLRCPDRDRAARIAQEFARRRRERMSLFPEALACLTSWRDAGTRLGLVTNGDASQQRDKIERHRLAGFFDVIVIEGEFGAGKPDEVVYRHALDVLGANASESCMIGDHLEFDVAGAQRLGMRGIWVDRAGAGLPSGCAVQPDAVIRSLEEIGERSVGPAGTRAPAGPTVT